MILVLLIVQSLGLAAFGWHQRFPLEHLVLEMGLLGGLIWLAIWPRLTSRLQAVAASAGLISCSALLTHFSGGYIEAHFHFFVMVGLIVLYEDWLPFLLSIAYVAIHHGVVGTLDPRSVYNHPAALNDPWLFAGIHALFILALSAAMIVYWKVSEESRAITDVVLRSTSSGILGLDYAGTVRFANPAATALFARPAPLLVGRHVSDLVGPGIPSVPVAARSEARLRRPDGTSVPVDWSVTPVRDAGVTVGGVATFNDLSERVRAEEQLRRFNQELEQRVAGRTAELEAALHELEAFNSSVSHDLRSPLRVIRGFTEMVRAQGEEQMSAESQDLLRRVEEASARMAQTIEALLELSRVNRAPVQRETVDVGALALEILQRLADAQPHRKVRVFVQPGMRVLADPGLVHIVLSNLLGNAWKFTSERPEAQIEVGMLTDARHRTFFVRDNGVGFDPSEASKLFRAFERLESGRRFEGTGIGLATVDRALRRHGGTVHAVGAPGEGATFYFSFGADSDVLVTRPASADGNGASSSSSLEPNLLTPS